MSEQPQDDMRAILVTRQEAELIMDSFKVSNPISRKIALKAASLVLEFAGQDAVREAERLIDPAG